MQFLLVGIFILCDIVSGVLKSIKEKSFTSSAMREGLYHKCGSIMCVTLAVVMDYAQTLLEIGVTVPITTAVCSYIALMEIGSIIENLAVLNPQLVPSKLKEYFFKIKGD